MTHIVRSVDVGYGNTKFTMSPVSNQEIECKMFPSLAPQTSTTGDLGAGMLTRRDTVQVSFNGVNYEVGPDAELAQSGIARNRHLMADYCLSNAYMALLKGALFYMNEPVIDLLVLGLPVSTYGQLKDELTQRSVGIHECGTKKITVKHVRVYPQPLGGFFDYSVRSRLFQQMSQETNLLIDPGFYTIDWLMTQGLKTIDARSGAANDGGMGSILRAISKEIAKDFDVDETELGEVAKIDAAIRGVKPLRLFGEIVDMKKYMPIGLSKAEEAINQMLHTIGSKANIGNIVLVGGGNHFYRDLLQKSFSRHKIAVAYEPLFANVRGFQIIGEQRVKQIVDSASVAHLKSRAA